MGTYAWNTLYSKNLPAKSRTRRRRRAAQGSPSQPVHRNLATGPKQILVVQGQQFQFHVNGLSDHKKSQHLAKP